MPKAKQIEGRPEVPDESLMARYVDGDAEAFDELFRRYERRAYAFFVRRTGSGERSEDLYQELFLRIHRARRTYDSKRPFSPWLFQIAHRLWVDDVRRTFRSREVSLEARDIASGFPGIERVLADREDLCDALDALTPEERHVLVSFKIDGREYSELAARLGKSSMQSGRSRLARCSASALRRVRASRALRNSEVVDA